MGADAEPWRKPLKSYFVYILASHPRTLDIGMTSDLEGRIYQHKRGTYGGFTTKYHVNQLVYYEEYADPRDATARERQLKGWRRDKKTALIEGSNPGWHDLSNGWGMKGKMSSGWLAQLELDPSAPQCLRSGGHVCC